MQTLFPALSLLQNFCSGKIIGTGFEYGRPAGFTAMGVGGIEMIIFGWRKE